MIWISINYPVFVHPTLRWITEIIVGKIIEILLIKSEFAVFFLYIDTRESHNGELFAQMAHENQRALENGTEEQKKQAEKNLINAFKLLAKF